MTNELGTKKVRKLSQEQCPPILFLVWGSGTVTPVWDKDAIVAEVNSVVTRDLQVSPGPVALPTILAMTTGPSISLSPGTLTSLASR